MKESLGALCISLAIVIVGAVALQIVVIGITIIGVIRHKRDAPHVEGE